MISALLFSDYLECPTKCWLRSRAEPSGGNAYAEWARLQTEAYYEHKLKYLLSIFAKSDQVFAPPVLHDENATWRLAINVWLQTKTLESRLRAVERVPSKHRGKFVFIPYRFQFTNKLTKNDKLALAFDALVLSALGFEVSLGKIIHGDDHLASKFNLRSYVGDVKKLIVGSTEVLARNSPPDLVLIPHCNECEFRRRCRQVAIEKDDLTLLSSMSEKERKKLREKGIFTITQLSYTFRPRRRARKLQAKPERFHHSLRALSIRESKIHAVDLIVPDLDGTPVFLDVEGLPDRDFYYLVGMRVGTGNNAVHHSFWADDEDGEHKIWDEFIGLLSSIPEPRIVHYGRYEKDFLKRMQERYGGLCEGSPVSTAMNSTVNLLSFIFAHVYFPTFSNGLKEIANYLGFQWLSSPSSGLEAIVWRHRWEDLRDPIKKRELLDYNRKDCEALEIVASGMKALHRGASGNGNSSQNNLILVSEMKRKNPFPFRFGRNAFAIPELETINKAAYWNYQRERVYLKSLSKHAHARKHPSTLKGAQTPNTTVECRRPESCPTCKSDLIYRHGKRSKNVVDIRFMRHGLKRWITRYVIHRYRCLSYRSTFYPPDREWSANKYGRSLAAYTVYQNIELQLPQSRIASGVRQIFGLSISRHTVNRFKAVLAQDYVFTYDKLLKQLCGGHLLHVDETRASVMGKASYVWVLTSMEDVAYFYTPTREGATVQALLLNFRGVLVSDFYAVYDGIKCRQQKCLIHFIRDLNDELLKHPYDERLKQLAWDFTSLVKPMVETVDRRGLKKHFLGKYRISVDQFYADLDSKCDLGDAAQKFVERLRRNRDKLFTFLEFDDVPWNNNNAEHAIKAFASLRRIIEGKSTEKGLRDFLILLSICETCKYKGVPFLDFLRSGSKDIGEFAKCR